jgi:hypothetical protein
MTAVVAALSAAVIFIRATDQANAPHQCVTVPPGYSLTSRGMISPSGRGAPVEARRDGSVTLLGFCSESVTAAPRLRDATGTVDAFGGFLVHGDSGTANYLVYPPTSGARVDVVVNGATVATVRFPELTRSVCPLPDSADLHWVACNSIGLAIWNTHINVPASEIERVTAEALDDVGMPVTAWVESWESISGNLVVTIALDRPTGETIHLAIHDLSMLNGEQLKPLAEFRLVTGPWTRAVQSLP